MEPIQQDEAAQCLNLMSTQVIVDNFGNFLSILFWVNIYGEYEYGFRNMNMDSKNKRQHKTYLDTKCCKRNLLTLVTSHQQSVVRGIS